MKSTSSFIFCAITIASLVSISGCSPNDSPKIVPAKSPSGYSAPLSPEPPKVEIKIDKTLAGATKLCADFENQSVAWISYGDKGQFQIASKNQPIRSGFRFEMSSPVADKDRVGFQFEKTALPRLFKSNISDGRAAETLIDEKTNQPVMRCFKKIESEFLWIDYYLVEAANKISGAWNCGGPLGPVKIDENGAITTAMGAGELFLWSKNGAPFIDIFFRGLADANGRFQYESFFEAAVLFTGFKEGHWDYQVTSSTGQAQGHTCIRN